MKARKISILSTSVVLVFTAGMLSGCGGEPEEVVPESKEITAAEPIQSIETIIEPEPVTSMDDVEGIEPFGGMDHEGDAHSMEGILDEISDAASDTADAAEEVVTETTDIMKDFAEDGATDIHDTLADTEKDMTTGVETAVVEPVVEAVEDAEEVVATTPDLIRRVQQALVNAGYKPGPVDGISGPRTSAAIKNFQQDNNLAAGEITKETLRALGVDF